MTTKAGSNLDLAKQLVASLNTDSSTSPEELEVTARKIAAQIKAAAGAGMRKEWHDVRATLKGFVRMYASYADIQDYRVRLASVWRMMSPLRMIG